jgi:hypothetical protein
VPIKLALLCQNHPLRSYYSTLGHVIYVRRIELQILADEIWNGRPRMVSVARQRHGKHFSTVTNNQSTTGQLLEAEISMRQSRLLVAIRSQRLVAAGMFRQA